MNSIDLTLIIHVAYIVVAAIAVFYFISIYNELVTLKNNIKKSWANIDVLLKKRHDELSKLIDTCKQYMGYESGTLEKLVAAREEQHQASKNNNIPKIGESEDKLRLGLKNVLLRAEAYPELKANDSFHQLSSSIDGLETAIAARREFYNDSVTINNTTIEQFPKNIVAGIFRFKNGSLLEFSAAEKQDVNVQDLFNN